MTARTEHRVSRSSDSGSAPEGQSSVSVEDVADENVRAYIESIEERLDQIAIRKTIWYGKFGADYFTSETGQVSRYYYELGYIQLDGAWRICYRFCSEVLDENLMCESATAQETAPLIHAPWYIRGEMIECVDCLASLVLSLE